MTWLVQALIPPAAREEVIGDLWESYSSPLRYLSEGIGIMPYAVASQVRRTSVAAVLALQGFALYACLGGFSVDMPGASVPNWARAALPTAAALLALVLRDAYRGPSQRPLWSGIVDAVTAAIGVVLVEAVLMGLVTMHLLDQGWFLPPAFMILGSLAVPTVCLLRIASGLDKRSRLAVGDVGAGDLAGEYKKFQRGVGWRNLAEIGACLTVIAISAYFLLRFHPWVAPAGWTMLSIWLTLTAYLALWGWARRMPSDSGQLAAVYQRELRRQHALRRVMWWWWFVPLFVGLGTNFIAPGIAKNQPIHLALGTVAATALAFCIAKLIADRGRVVRAEVTALNTLIA